jgi:hypothetical protein
VVSNAISFAWAETARGNEYSIESSQDGWAFTVKVPGASAYSLNGTPVTATAGEIRMGGRRNHLLVVPAH